MDDSLLPTARIYRRADLNEFGLTNRVISRRVADGLLLRAREGIYLFADAPIDVVDACRVGGQLTCVSELARIGVFVLGRSALHVHLADNAARLRSVSRRVRRHWARLRRPPHPAAYGVDPFDALLQSVRCQPPRESVATLDSALHRGVLRIDDLDEFFFALPQRFEALRLLLDARAESGPESLLRLILRSLGVPFDVQVEMPHVGRVDFLVDGWLIVECDSIAHHSDPQAQRRDRRRDQAAAGQGFHTHRVLAEDVMYRPIEVRAALQGLLSRPPRSRFRRTVG